MGACQEQGSTGSVVWQAQPVREALWSTATSEVPQ
jgi:hypothetical protein